MKNPINCIRSFLQDKPATNRLLLYFLITLIFFGAFCKLDFATDTYADILADYSEIAGNFLRCGRIFTAGLYTIFHFTHLDIRLVSFASFVLAILSLTFALYILEKLLRENFIKSNFWSFILPILIIINPFIIELFLFVEKGIMCLSILCCVISAYYFNSYLNSRSRKDFLKILIINLVATTLYQGTIGIFIILATTITVLKSKTWQLFIKNTLLSVFLYLIGPVINLFIIKIFFSNGRANGGLHPLKSAQVILENLGKPFNLFDTIPPLLFWGILGLILALWTFYLLRTHKLRIIPYLQLIYLSVVIILASVAPQIALQPDNVWLAPRSVYPFAAIIGINMTIIGYTSPRFLSINPYKILLITGFLCLGFAQFYAFNRIIIDHYTISTLDRLRAQSIGRIINNYEAVNNTTITHIAVAPDQYMSYSYPGMRTLADSNITAFSTDWSDVASINYWNRRSFERIEPSEDWVKYCSSQDWIEQDDAQIMITGDTLYLCIF